MPVLHVFDSHLNFPDNEKMASFQVFMTRRFRDVGKGFFLGLTGTESGTLKPVTQSFWIDPSSHIRFEYDAGDQVVADEDFIKTMTKMANSDFGVQFAEFSAWPFMVLTGGGMVDMDVTSDPDAGHTDPDASVSPESPDEQ